MNPISSYLERKKIEKLSALCNSSFRGGDFLGSLRYCKELLELVGKKHGPEAVELLPVLNRQAEIAIAAGDPQTAKRCLKRELEIALKHSDWGFVDRSLVRQLLLARDEGDLEYAAQLAETRIEYARKSGDSELFSRVMANN